MKCPVDGSMLAMAERAGVEIDYCPECRGVWLDRGELDRIIERSTVGVRQDERPAEYRRGEAHDRHRDDEHDHRHDRDHDDDRFGRSGRKRGGALSALTGLLGGED